MVSVQVETWRVMDNLDEILSVEGVNACYIGPWDLSSNPGFGMPPKWGDPHYLEAFDRVLEAAEEDGKPAGLFCSIDNIGWAMEKSFKFNTVENADSFLMHDSRMGL